jgi:hypothetical protein
MNMDKSPLIARRTGSPPAIPGKVRVAVAGNQRLNRWELLFRAVIMLILLASLALAWWTFTKVFIPAQRRSLEFSAKLAALSSEVDQLERKWGQADAEEIRRRYREVHGQLFADEASFETWLANLQTQAGQLGLEAKIELSPGRPAATNERTLAIVSASISLDVRPLPGRDETAYQRLLLFTQRLAAEGKRADLAQMTVVGGSASIPQATLVFNLWAGEEGRQ